MSAKLRHFRPRDENNVPGWPYPDPPPYPEAVYVLSLRVVDNRLEYYFIEQPDTPSFSDDTPLTIAVMKNTTVVLRLDPAWDWAFPEDNAIALGPQGHSSKGRYFGLTYVKTDGVCREVRFIAQYLGISEGNVDPYSIYVTMGQSNPAQRLLIRIDPMLRNPGDHPPPPQT